MMRRGRLVLILSFSMGACQVADAPDPVAPDSAGDRADAASFAFATGGNAGVIGDSIPDEWIVVFDAAANADRIRDGILATHGGQLRFRYTAALKGFAARLAESAVAELRRTPGVAYVEPDRRGGIIATQTPAEWGLDRLDQRDLPLTNSYTYSTTGAGTRAYVLDTGIRPTHVEFGGRASFIANGANGDFVGDAHGAANGALDCHGHGTHVAGTLGGTTYGVAKDVQLIAGRVVNCSGSGTVSMAIAGVDWIRLNGVQPAVVNMSLGYGNVQSLRDAVENAIAAGFHFSVSAGNGDASGRPLNACTQSPAGAPNANTVGATTITDGEASFSNFGPCVDMLAPGVDVRSAWYTSNTATATLSGTSMAAPHVAGVIALYLEANPAHTPAEATSALVANATLNRIALHSSSATGGTANRLLYMGFIAGGAPVPPVAGFEHDCAGRQCSFRDASTDTDGRIVSRTWEFADGSTATEASPSHTYVAGGTYSVKLTVTDNDGLSHSTTAAVTTNASTNRPPTANYRSSCPSNSCTFTNLSADADGSVSAAMWLFGDGTSSTATSPAKTYAAAGTYTVTLRVTDNGGAVHWQTMPVVVNTANTNPFASFTFPASALSVSFTDHSFDSDGSISSRRWYFGDGATSTAANPTHTYPAGGTYAATLEVTDNLGAKHLRTRQFTLVPPANVPPTADFTFSCTALACDFTDTSTDPDGSVVAWNWTFGDGVTATVPHPSHTYAAGGTYSVVLTVTDNRGATASVTRAVTVAPAAIRPTAGFEHNCAGRVCSFNDTSVAGDTRIVTVVWELGDGTSSNLASPDHSYAAEGSYDVRVTVTDADGDTDTSVTTITVGAGSGNRPPTANLRYTASGSLTYGFTDISADPGGSVVARLWDFGDGSRSTATNPSRTYASPGTYRVTLRATDNEGAVDWQSVEIVVTSGDTNQPPFASFTYPNSGLTVDFSNFSTDDGGITSSYWEFGDGALSTQTSPSHTYAAAGTYRVTLLVTDDRGRKHSRTRQIIVP